MKNYFDQFSYQCTVLSTVRLTLKNFQQFYMQGANTLRNGFIQFIVLSDVGPVSTETLQKLVVL